MFFKMKLMWFFFKCRENIKFIEVIFIVVFLILKGYIIIKKLIKLVVKLFIKMMFRKGVE